MPTRYSPEQPIVTINTPAEYEAARQEVKRLAKVESGSVDELTFQAFSAAIEVYEARQGDDPISEAAADPQAVADQLSN